MGASEKEGIYSRHENSQRLFLVHCGLPFLLLSLALFGGMRFKAESGAFIFLLPPLAALIFAAMLMLIYFRSGYILLGDWLSAKNSIPANISGGIILFALFAASAQLFNSLLPERSLPYWIFGFCFFWSLWVNLFSGISGNRLLQSLGALFGLAFAAKYLLLAGIASNPETWTQRLLESFAKEASFGLLDIPKFAPATGYLQFFVLALYFLGVYMASSIRPKGVNSNTSSETTS